MYGLHMYKVDRELDPNSQEGLATHANL